ncbi:MAG: stage III sporulation protein AB [Oscillospiraceae bacterium]|nr:stage III sporulation protein AB [Oscillospiraceae bacterium]
MSVKYIGAILIFVSCGAFGFIMAANYRREERCLAELVGLLGHMHSELEFRLSPLPQICAAVAKEATGCLRKVFTILAQELENQISPDAATCMQAALASVKELPSGTKKALIALGNSLGKFDLEGQMNEISAVRQQCMSTLEQMRAHQDVRLRSYQTLGLCVGAGLAILFL